jgi:predicted TIM-barrel fold metal-dependent hydrolase
MMIVDTHTHVYSSDETRYPMRDNPKRPPKGTGTLDCLRRDMLENNVDRAVIIHSDSSYGWDNRFVADLLPTCQEFATGVCTLSPFDAENPNLLKTLLRERGFRGLRVFPVEDADGKRSLELRGHLTMCEQVAELNGVILALIWPEDIERLPPLLKRFPSVPVMLDHCAHLNAADVPDSETLRKVLALAEFPNLYAKITGLITGSRESYPFRDTHPIAYKVIEAFGPDRCMWGSIFPCELWLRPDPRTPEPPKGAYADQLRLFTHELGLDVATKSAILGQTAKRVWFPEEGGA